MRFRSTAEADSKDRDNLLAFRVAVGIGGCLYSRAWRVNPATLGDAAISITKDGYLAYELNNSKLFPQ